MKYDFIVIGAGLTGSYFADLASRFGSVLLIEKQKRTRQFLNELVFEKHNEYFFNNETSLPLDNKNIFPKEHYEITYSGKQGQGTIDGREFNSYVGHYCHLSKLNEFLADRAEKNGAFLKFKTEVKNVNVTNEGVKIITDSDEEFFANFLILTGGTGLKNDFSKFNPDITNEAFHLQQSLGFKAPDLYYCAFTQFEGKPDTIRHNISNEYIYHYNRKISPVGPLYTTRWEDHFNIGVIHNDPVKVMERLTSLIQRYKHVQNYFRDVKPANIKGGKSTQGYSIIQTYFAKHHIPKRAMNRVFVLGEAAGLVTDFFYEGCTGAVCSAKLAADSLRQFMESNQNIQEYQKSELQTLYQSFDQKLDTTLIKSYLKSQHGSEVLWMHSGEAGETIFNVYAKLLGKRRDLRKYVFEALVLDDLSKYNFENDRKSGEEMYKALPLSQKVVFTPYFLKAM